MHRFSHIFPLLLLLMVVVACGSQPSASTPASPSQKTQTLTFTDATNTTVTLTKRPTRIACLVGICEDILAELGLQPVAVNDTIGQDPAFFGAQAKSFAVIGGPFFNPNVEDIAKANPDLVIGLANVHESLRDALKPIAPLYILPRTLIAIVVGAMLGLAGALLQTIMRNPLAEPEMTGATSGAVLFAVLWLARGPAQMAQPGLVLPLVALLGGVAAGGLVYILSWSQQSMPSRLVLTGVVVSVVLRSSTSIVLLLRRGCGCGWNYFPWTHRST